MTDSNQAPNPSPNDSPDYEGSDPDRSDRAREGQRIGVSTVQVGASAAAAVTSALAASFFGVAGTLIGAAVGSIVSTIAGALYTEYLSRAGERIRVTRSVTIQRIPSGALTTTPLRQLTRPTDLPGQESLRPIGAERGDETIALPVEDAAELRRHPEGMAPLGHSGASRAASNGAGNHDPAAFGRPVPPPARSAWKRPVIAMAAVSAAGFLIALGVVLVTETAIGHPVSGGDSGTTISNIGTDTSSKTEIKPTEAPTVTETNEPSDTATTDEEAPVPSTDPAQTGETDPEPTDEATSEPSAESTDPGAEATEPGAEADELDAQDATEAP